MYDTLLFWTSYPSLLSTFIYTHSVFCRYELRAIQKEKIRSMETENGKSKEVITVEVEMQESRGSRGSQPSEFDLESQS